MGMGTLRELRAVVGEKVRTQNKPNRTEQTKAHRTNPTEQTKSHRTNQIPQNASLGWRESNTKPWIWLLGVFGAAEHEHIHRDENIQDSQAGKEFMRGMSCSAQHVENGIARRKIFLPGACHDKIICPVGLGLLPGGLDGYNPCSCPQLWDSTREKQIK